MEQGDYPDQPGTDDHGDNDVAGTSGRIDNSGPIPVHPPTGADPSECETSFDTNYETDVLKLLDQGIDFGDNFWLGNAPLGVASVQWGVECGFCDADVVGTLHLDGIRGQSGRIHAAFFLNGELQETFHSRILTATDNGHFSRSVHLASPAGVHVTEVHVCTEISDDGVHFESVNCKARFIGS